MNAYASPLRTGRAGLFCALALLAAACGSELTDQTPGQAGAPPVDVPVGRTPAARTLSIPAGSAVQLAAEGGEGAVTWELLNAAGASAGATIDEAGRLQATVPGRYLVLAARDGARLPVYVTVTPAGGTAEVARFAVRFDDAALASLSLTEFWIEATPDSVTVAPTDTAQFSALGHSADGSRWTIRQVWSAESGTVLPAGQWVAPADTGAHRVVVTRFGDVQSDTVRVRVATGSVVPDTTVAAPPAAPTAPAAPVSAACTNEPAGYRRVSDAPWNVLPGRAPNASSEGYSYWLDQIPTLSLVQDATAPGSPGSALKVNFPGGMTGGYAPSRWGSPDLGQNGGNLYVCLWIKYDAHWSTNGISTDKIYYVLQDAAPIWHAQVALGESDSLFPHALLQFADDRLNYNIGQKKDPQQNLAGGGWHKLEVLWEANTPGQRNGLFKQWVDDRLVGEDHTALWFPSGVVPRYDVVWFDPIWAYPAAVIPRDQAMYLDHTVISVK